MVAKKSTKKTAVKAKTGGKTKSKVDPLYPARAKSFRIGQDILPKGRDLGRYVRWPRYVRIQRQRKILLQRLKVPPSINQFSNKLDKSQATELFGLLAKYRPESKAEKKERLKKLAEAKVAGGSGDSGKPPAVVKYGLHHVTTLIEEKKAKLVIIASDVVPLELVVWIPALCRKMDIPYCIVNNKGRLGAVVHKKRAAVLAITEVNKEHESKLAQLANVCRAQFNDNKDALRKWGGGVMGLRTQAKLERRRAALEAEEAKKRKMLM
uniref:60S ribosomal protein L7a n=1 Tax=Mucochytrium quahogii TaxID=96639 RepID=A0A7S2WM83_9STRA|mmetsp:Transcript_20016/g.33021  ORF Transcript_20016/g.33021 Transcript_20016/m.33021 type:complete len:266 (-) Transcript_20016:3305-4102(-)